MRKPTILAHRGATAYAPENSIEAIQKTVDLGLEGLEIDIRQTSDGGLVSFHDDNLMRLTGYNKKVADCSVKELRRLTLKIDDSNNKKPLTGACAFLPDILDITRGKLLLNIELKGPSWKIDSLQEDLIQPLVDQKMLDQVIISSFYHLPLLRIQRLKPSVRTGMLIHPSQMRIGRPGWSARWLNLYSIHPPHHLASGENIIFWKNAGYAVYVWTVNNVSDYKNLFEYGVDGIITDIPEELSKEVEQSHAAARVS